MELEAVGKEPSSETAGVRDVGRNAAAQPAGAFPSKVFVLAALGHPRKEPGSHRSPGCGCCSELEGNGEILRSSQRERLRAHGALET